MSVNIPLDRMSTADKLRALEEIWDDLSRNAADIPAPGWHDDVLKARERKIAEGASTFDDWPDVKRRLLGQTRQ
jgi:gamma-glutamyl phosphate reductase